MIHGGMEYREAFRQTVKELSGLTNSQNQARWLVCEILHCPMERLLIVSSVVTDEQALKLNEAIVRLLHGYPLQYVLGSTQFMGLPFCVRENVLIPRNDTEVLAELAIRWIGDKTCRVLDLCCGSGCIGIAIAHYCAGAKVVLADISKYALSLTRENSRKNSVDVEIVETDLFSAVTGQFDCIVCNPPYVCREEQLPKNVRYEPELALFGGEDGLDFYRGIQQHYAAYLRSGGILLLEIGDRQGAAVRQIFGGGRVEKDLNGLDRVFILE